jgi:hypothetical protein
LNGGNLVLSNAVAMHDFTVNGGTFYVAPGANITGNLVVQNVVGGTSVSQLCGSSVQGNVQIHNSGVPVYLGSNVPSACPGNTIGNDLQVYNNTAETELIGNTVHGNLQDHDNSALTLIIGNSAGNDLQCQSNIQIVGGPNTAKQIQGQCY